MDFREDSREDSREDILAMWIEPMAPDCKAPSNIHNLYSVETLGQILHM